MLPAAQLALEPLGGQGRLALGWVVFFQDGNRNGVLDLGVHLLGKPFTVEQLAAKLREVLEEPAPKG